MYTVHAVSKYSRVHERSETTRGANLPFHLCLDREFVSTNIVYSTDTQEEDAKRPKVSSRLVDKCAESGVTIAGERLVRTGKAQDRLIWISTTSSQRLDLLEVTTRLNSRSIRHRLTR